MLESPHTGMWRYTRRAGNESEPSKSIGDRDGEASPRSLLRRIKKKKTRAKKNATDPSRRELLAGRAQSARQDFSLS